MKNSSFVGGNIDQCLNAKKSTKGIVYIALYVEDNLVVVIDDFIEALKSKGLVLKIVDGLQDYLSCKIKFSNNRKCAWFQQPHLIKNLENKFGGLVKGIQNHKTPGTPKFLIFRPMEEIKKIMIEDQQEY